MTALVALRAHREPAADVWSDARARVRAARLAGPAPRVSRPMPARIATIVAGWHLTGRDDLPF